MYFRQEFKTYFGLSPLAYIRLVRLNNAKALLRSGCHTVTDTAVACGYNSPSCFSYDFHKLTGLPANT